MITKIKAAFAGLFFTAIVAIGALPASAQINASQTWVGTSGGTANAQTVTLNNVTQLADLIGVPIRFIPVATNTGATTLQVSNSNFTLTATAITRPSASAGAIALQGGELRIGSMAVVVYDGTSFQLITHASVVYKQTLLLTSTQTYTPSAGLAWAEVTVIGGGGAGGGAAATSSSQLSAGSGGGAGGIGMMTLTAAQIGANQSVTVGTGGSGVAGSAGGNGAASSFGAFCTANGGTGGALGTANGGVLSTPGSAGGAVSGCDTSVTGSGGQYSFVSTITATTSAASEIGGLGGPGYLGGGLGAGASTPAAAGGYGTGGTGSYNSFGSSAVAGANGANGRVIIKEYVYN